MSGTRATRNGLANRDNPPQVRAIAEAINTQRGPIEVLYIVPRCDLCGGKHRHRSSGLRVSGCRRGLYLVVA